MRRPPYYPTQEEYYYQQSSGYRDPRQYATQQSYQTEREAYSHGMYRDERNFRPAHIQTPSYQLPPGSYGMIPPHGAYPASPQQASLEFSHGTGKYPMAATPTGYFNEDLSSMPFVLNQGGYLREPEYERFDDRMYHGHQLPPIDPHPNMSYAGYPHQPHMPYQAVSPVPFAHHSRPSVPPVLDTNLTVPNRSPPSPARSQTLRGREFSPERISKNSSNRVARRIHKEDDDFDTKHERRAHDDFDTKHERRAHDDFIALRTKMELPCRTLFIRNASPSCNPQQMKKVFERHGAVRIFHDQHIENKGIAFVSYFDLRDAERAKDALQGYNMNGRKWDVHFSLPRNNEEVSGPCSEDKHQGTLIVTIIDATSSFTKVDVQKLFSTQGQIRSVRDFHHIPHKKFVEYFDERDCRNAFHSLNGITFKGGRILLKYSWDYPRNMRISSSQLKQDYESGTSCVNDIQSEEEYNHQNESINGSRRYSSTSHNHYQTNNNLVMKSPSNNVGSEEGKSELTLTSSPTINDKTQDRVTDSLNNPPAIDRNSPLKSSHVNENQKLSSQIADNSGKENKPITSNQTNYLTNSNSPIPLKSNAPLPSKNDVQNNDAGTSSMNSVNSSLMSQMSNLLAMLQQRNSAKSKPPANGSVVDANNEEAGGKN